MISFESEFIHSVYDRAEGMAVANARGDRQSQLLQTAFSNLRRSGRGSGTCVEWPLLVYRGLGGAPVREMALVTATTLFYLGVDLFDDVADGDLLQEIWSPTKPAEVDLIAATLFFSFSSLALTELARSGAEAGQLQEILARGFLEMAAGQQTDIAMAGSDSTSADEVELSVQQKSGAEFAMFFQWAAVAAQRPPDQLPHCASFGMTVGTAGQLASDCHDLFISPWSRDLRSGTRTLPIALHLDTIAGEADRRHFLDLLDRAKTDGRKQAEVRQRLISAGVPSKMAFIVEMYLSKAEGLLARLNPSGPAGEQLRARLRQLSLTPPPLGRSRWKWLASRRRV